MNLIDLVSLSSWSFWILLGAVFFIVEALSPTFLALGFGIGAWLVAGLVGFVLPIEWVTFPSVVVLWAVLSACTWIGLRVVFKNRHSGNDADDGDINEY